jgi:hypothetical protein
MGQSCAILKMPVMRSIVILLIWVLFRTAFESPKQQVVPTYASAAEQCYSIGCRDQGEEDTLRTIGPDSTPSEVCHYVLEGGGCSSKIYHL